MSWDFVSWVGLGLNSLGLVVTVVTVYGEMTGKDLDTRTRRALSRAWLLFRIHVLRQQRNVNIHGAMAVGRAEGHFEFTGSATGVVGTGDPIEDRFRVLESNIERLEADAKVNREADLRRLEEVKTSLDRDITDVRTRITEAEEQAREIEAKTKDWEMAGLGLVALGTVLQGAAIVFGGP
jgi:hypothetical protein